MVNLNALKVWWPFIVLTWLLQCSDIQISVNLGAAVSIFGISDSKYWSVNLKLEGLLTVCLLVTMNILRKPCFLPVLIIVVVPDILFSLFCYWELQCKYPFFLSYSNSSWKWTRYKVCIWDSRWRGQIKEKTEVAWYYHKHDLTCIGKIKITWKNVLSNVKRGML